MKEDELHPVVGVEKEAMDMGDLILLCMTLLLFAMLSSITLLIIVRLLKLLWYVLFYWSPV